MSRDTGKRLDVGRCTHAVADGSVVEVEALCSNQRALEDIVDDPQRSTEGGTDPSAAACRYRMNKKTRLLEVWTHAPEFVSPRKNLLPALCAAVASALYWLT